MNKPHKRINYYLFAFFIYGWYTHIEAEGIMKNKHQKTDQEKTQEIKRYMVKSVKDFNWLRRLWQFIVIKFWYGLSFKFIYRYEVYGKENIPKDNNYVVVGNHLSTLDPLLIVNIMPNPVSYLAKKELFYHPFIKVMLDWLGAIAVDREKVGVSTIKSAKSVKDTKKWVLGLFPQGTREKGNEIHTVTKGFTGLAKATKCNILPIGIVGTDKPKVIPFTGKIIVKIGKIIEYTDSQEEIIRKWVDSIQELTGFKYVPEDITE